MPDSVTYFAFRDFLIPQLPGLRIWADYFDDRGVPAMLIIEDEQKRFSISADYSDDPDRYATLLNQSEQQSYRGIEAEGENRRMYMAASQASSKEHAAYAFFRFEVSDGRQSAAVGCQIFECISPRIEELFALPLPRQLWENIQLKSEQTSLFV